MNSREIASSNKEKVWPTDIEQSMTLKLSQSQEVKEIKSASSIIHKIASNLGMFDLEYPEFLVSGIKALLQSNSISQIDKEVNTYH